MEGGNPRGCMAQVLALTVSAACLARASRASAWDIRHNVSVAAGALVSRALLAFTYYPVLGDVSAVAKYLHNVVLLATIVVVWVLAARSASELITVADAPRDDQKTR